MAELQKHVAYLSQEIGPRPAGTEEEQRAALYISEKLSTDAGLPTVMEDFSCNPDAMVPRLVCFGAAAVVTLLATVINVLAIPALLIALVCAGLYGAEIFEKPVLSRFLNRGVSQNVVAKYEPPVSGNRSSRRRKIILVANYDTGKVRRDLKKPVLGALPILYWVEFGALALMPVIMLIRTIANPQDAGLVAFNVILAVLMIICVLPVVSFILEHIAPYNEGANCNASGVAVLMETAQRVAASATSAPADSTAFIHGEGAAEASGFVPEGAELVYEAEPSVSGELNASMESAEARLAAAKAAVAALSGRPVSDTVNVVDRNDEAEQAAEPEEAWDESSSAQEGEGFTGYGEEIVSPAALNENPVEDRANDQAAAAAPVYTPAPAPASASAPISAQENSVPDWFRKGIEEAKKPAVEAPIHRSRYAEALDLAEQEINDRIAAEQEAARAAFHPLVPAAPAEAEPAADVVSAPSEGTTASKEPASPASSAPAPAPAPTVEPSAAPVNEALAASSPEDSAPAAPGSSPEPSAVPAPAAAAPATNFDAVVANEAVAAAIADEPLTSADIPVAGAAADQDQALPYVPEIPMMEEDGVIVRTESRPLTGSLPRITVDADEVPSIDAVEKPELERGAANEALADLPTPETSPSALAADGPTTSAGPRVTVPEVGAEDVVVIPAVDQPARPQRRRRTISLPHVGISQQLPRLVVEERQQSAPLAEEHPAGDGRVHDLSSVVPTMADEGASHPARPQRSAEEVIAEATAVVETQEATQSRAAENLIDALPSLSGNQNQPTVAVPSVTDSATSGAVSVAGSFNTMGATGMAAPVGEELLEDAAPGEIFIDDADDSVYSEQATGTGAIAGPGYVDMPKGRFSGFFSKFRSKKRKTEETSAREWLDVDEDFDARQVGKERGGWESFRQDDGSFEEAEEITYDATRSYDNPEQTTAFTPEFIDSAFDEEADELPVTHRPRRRQRNFEGGAFSRAGDGFEAYDEGAEEAAAAETPRGATNAFGLPADFVFDSEPEETQVDSFHSPRIDTEVWFVALGSELAGNGGMRAFMEEHADELRGSIIINIEALGAGELTLLEKEGTYFAKKASSRMKRLVKKAGKGVGLNVPTGSMEWMNSASAYAMKHGQQAMHIAGMEDGKPTFFGEADDVVENVDEDMMELNTEFVMDLIRSI